MKGAVRGIVLLTLCFTVLLTLSPSAQAAALDTTKVAVERAADKTVVTIDAQSDGALQALNAEGKTAKIAVPTDFTPGAQVYVLKDHASVVAHSWVDGRVQFAVPGAGVYEILQGAPPTLDEQLDTHRQTIVLTANDTLSSSKTVADGTVICADGHMIQGQGGQRVLTAQGSLTLNGLNGAGDVILGAGDKAAFEPNGTATITAAMDKNAKGEPVGYGSVKLTTVINGKPVTKTYFLAAGETIVLRPDGTIVCNGVFAPCKADAAAPDYQVFYDAHNNSHQLNTSGKVQAWCNGLYDYYTTVTLTLQGTSEEKILAVKKDGTDILCVSGVQIHKGGTGLTLDSSYLNTLPVGTHRLTFHYNDGAGASGNLYITKAAQTAGTASSAHTTNPKTGDTVLSAVLVMALCAAWLEVAGKKSQHFNRGN